MKKTLLLILLLIILTTYTFASADLARGSKGKEVMSLQQALINQGYLNGKADGDFGKKTEEAVKAFQRASGLPETGIADTATLETLLGETASGSTSESEISCRGCGRKVPANEGYSFCPYCGAAISVETNDTPTETLSAGDIVVFGHYEQDADSSNGPEEIEWRVLETNGESALMISQYALDDVPFSEHWDDTVGLWHVCDLHTWLNHDFLDTAFTEEEKSRLTSVSVTADRNPDYSTPPGDDTEDMVFLLSVTQVKRFFPSKSDRVVLATPYAIDRGVYLEDNGSCWWWTRTPGYTDGAVALVDNDGTINTYGCGVLSDRGGVRPVIALKLR